MSYTSLKKRFTEGSTVRVRNNLHPHLSGIRTVIKQQTNAIKWAPFVNPQTDQQITNGWMHWPKANEVRVYEPEVEGQGVPRIEFLNTANGEVAFTYELLEEA